MSKIYEALKRLEKNLDHQEAVSASAHVSPDHPKSGLNLGFPAVFLLLAVLLGLGLVLFLNWRLNPSLVSDTSISKPISLEDTSKISEKVTNKPRIKYIQPGQRRFAHAQDDTRAVTNVVQAAKTSNRAKDDKVAPQKDKSLSSTTSFQKALGSTTTTGNPRDRTKRQEKKQKGSGVNLNVPKMGTNLKRGHLQGPIVSSNKNGSQSLIGDTGQETLLEDPGTGREPSRVKNLSRNSSIEASASAPLGVNYAQQKAASPKIHKASSDKEPLALLVLAEEARRRGEIGKALNYYRLCLKRHFDPGVANNYGALLLSQGHIEEALAVLKRAYQATKDKDPAVAFNLALAWVQAGDRQKACVILEQGTTDPLWLSKWQALWHTLGCASSSTTP